MSPDTSPSPDAERRSSAGAPGTSADPSGPCPDGDEARSLSDAAWRGSTDSEPRSVPEEPRSVPESSRARPGAAPVAPDHDGHWSVDAARALSRLCPWPVDPDPDLDRSLGYLGVRPPGETVARAADVVGVLVALVVLPVGLAFGTLSITPVLALGAGVATARGLRRLPVDLAAMRRTRAVGDAADLVGLAALRMRVEPTPERAARFAARTGTGPLAASLRGHVERAAGTPESGLDGFAREWRTWFPALDRAVALVASAADAPAEERDRTLDRAVDAVLDGTRDRLADFAGDLRGPASGLYAFGVLLPLALVGILPAARVAGVAVPLVAFAFVYDLALPLGLAYASWRLLLDRPAAFAPPSVTRAHPDVPDRAWPTVAAGVGGAAGAWAAAAALVAGWAGPVAAAGVGTGAALVVRYRPVKAVRDRVRAIESGLDDALYLVGRRVAAGVAVERALATAADETPGETGETLAAGVAVGRRIRVGVRESFLGEHGALATVPSPRARGAAVLLALAASEGRPAGRALVSVADQLGRLRRVEREARRELASVTGTLANTAALFGPLVGGATVALAGGMAERGAAGGRATDAVGPALATGDVGLVVGAYVLALAAVLTALATGLERGLDRALLGYRVGLALLSATVTYLASVVGAGLLV